MMEERSAFAGTAEDAYLARSPRPAFACLLAEGSAPTSQVLKRVQIDLDASVGDTLEMTFFEVGPKEQLTTRVESFEISGIVEMTGLAADRNLVPDFPGISDAANMVDWDPPFPVDLGLIRPQDEDYWDEYRATPKAFFALERGRSLWGTRFGATTSMRFAPGAGETLEELAARLETELPSAFNPGRRRWPDADGAPLQEKGGL